MGAPAAEVISTDLADGSAISGLCEDVLKRHGHIDVLVNNAGIASWEGQGPTDGEPPLHRFKDTFTRRDSEQDDCSATHVVGNSLCVQSRKHCMQHIAHEMSG